MTYRTNPDPNLPDAGLFVYQLHEHVADNVGDEHADEYLTETVRELFTLAPAVREAVLGAANEEVREEMLREDTPETRAAVAVLDAALRRIQDAS